MIYHMARLNVSYLPATGANSNEELFLALIILGIGATIVIATRMRSKKKDTK